MRSFSLLTLCMAGAISLSATGKAGQSAAPVASAKNTQTNDLPAQNPPAQQVVERNAAAQNGRKPSAPKKEVPAQSAAGGQNTPGDAWINPRPATGTDPSVS